MGSRTFSPLRLLSAHVNQGLALTDRERLEHLTSVLRLRDSRGDGVLDILYRDLTILDDKATSLLTYNSIILAAVTIFVATSEALWLQAGFAAILLVTAASCSLCLRVIWVHWSEAASLPNPEAFWLDLIVVRDRRTRQYRTAWLLSALALALVAVGTMLSLLD